MGSSSPALVPGGRGPPNPFRRRLHLSRETWVPLAFLLPSLAYIGYFAFYPSVDVVWLSFQTPYPAAFGYNYGTLVQLGVWNAIENTVVVTAGALTIQLVAGMAIATVLTKEFRGKGVFSSIAILPIGFATVVAAFAFSLIFPAVGGYANSALVGFGLPPVDWIHPSAQALITIMLADSWKNTPLVTIILLAGMTTIPRSLYQAAAVDGAGPVRRLFYITLPNLKRFIAITLIIRGISEFNIFALPLVLVGSYPPLLTVLVYNLYSPTYPAIYQASAAASVLLAFVAVFIAIVIVMGGTRR